MAETSNAEAATEGTPRRRLWFPITLAVLAAGALAYAWGISDLARSGKLIITYGTALLGTALFFSWLSFMSGLVERWRRWAVFISPWACVGLFFAAFRVKCDGDNVPMTAELRFWPKSYQELPSGSPLSVPIELVEGAHDFPQFLGARRDNAVRDVRLARDWNANPPRRLWTTEVGAGFSSFAIVGNHAFTQEQRGSRETVTCYELKTGRLAWIHGDDVSFTTEFGGGDGPRSTPTVAGGRVYTMGARGLLNCLDARTGKALWWRNVLKEHGAGVTQWGKADSPLVAGDLVLVTGGGGRGPALLAFDRKTGEPKWSSAWNDAGGTVADSYASPALVTIGGVEQVLNVEDRGVASYALDGRRLWRFDWPWALAMHPKVSQPVFFPEGDGASGGGVLITSGYTSGSAMFRVKAESPGDFRTEPVWQNENLRTKFCNVVVQGDYIYGLDDTILACVDRRTGERKWKKGRYGHGQIMLIGDLIVVLTEAGEMALVEARPDKFVELARGPALGYRTWNAPAFSAPYLLIRNDREAACYELAVEGEQGALERED
ncbi:MAG: PQQ-like beta-propeller repeat protein [Planctomycetia bacterium]|nr:PQQ-like beta-propeller repeat protein [Planctomycetia bacterium]